MKTSRLHMWNGRALFYSPSVDTRSHQHHFLQITIGLDKAFLLRAKGSEKWERQRIVVIPPDQPHQLDGRNTSAVYLYADPESHLTRQLIPDAHYHKILSYDFKRIEPLLPQLWSYAEGKCNCNDALQLTDRIVRIISSSHVPISELDPRVQHALKIIRSLPEKHISVHELASQVLLSPSRLAYLFREQTGLPIRRYLLWERLLDAMRLMTQESDLSKVAHEAGFSDSAHMSRTFQKMFGITPSEIFKKNRLLKSYFAILDHARFFIDRVNSRCISRLGRGSKKIIDQHGDE
ncbi:MAG: AraC family transcriptional regulator [Caldithrix sp.]|nr:MAG: AraC family transcriptional regulator [Caldithrix sp.]